MYKFTFGDFVSLLVWGGGVVYSLGCFAVASRHHQRSLDQTDFENGWFPHSRKDVSDFEWLVMRSTFRQHWYLIVIHCVLSQCIRNKSPWMSTLFYAIHGTFSALLILNAVSVIFLWLNVLISFAIHKLHRPTLCYITCIAMIYLIHSEAIFSAKDSLFNGDNEKGFLFEVAIAWINAKCLSFSLDSIRARNKESCSESKTLLFVAAYCFYLPPFFTGPIHQYDAFVKSILVRKNTRVHNETMYRVMYIFRILFWALVLELMLHFIYSSSMQFYPEITDQMDGWTLCGFGYALPCLFYMKYLVMYGFASGVARLDGIELPPPPVCVTRIHLSSYLWRTFDRGLHLWLTNYIYKPLVAPSYSLKKRILAAALCFSFVCLWHGFDIAIITWCTINFFILSCEMFGSSITERSQGHSLGGYAISQIEPMASAPFFALMIVSNIFFLSNWELGCVFVKRILLTSPVPLLPTLMVMYAGCRTSTFFMQNAGADHVEPKAHML
ncbi:Protein-cysteine N-palmitoyltransferase HHAT [Halotydeus destructor]|nr:Protein-cysteine N-palmitoyltransferase HHAT [Halotydeus destructor]